MLSQHARSDLVNLADELEHLVIRELAKGKLALRNVARISLTQDSVAISGNNLTSVESGPQVVLDGLVTEVVANGSLHLCEPVKHFLICPVEVQRLARLILPSFRLPIHFQFVLLFNEG